jgi:AraC-like DNA-binding protein
MAADRICLQDWAHPYVTVAQSAEQFGVMIPRHRIVARDWVYERQPTMTWMLDSPQGRVLANAWMTLWQSLPHASAADAPTLAAGFLGLLNGLISPGPRDFEDPAMKQAMLPAMKRFLDSRLPDPELGIDHVVQAFRCSRSTAFRLFQEIGGVQRYIRDRRLAQCFRELTEPSSTPKRIHQLAKKWGFQDAHHFSRLFKRQFGLTPSEAAETAKPSAGELSVSWSSQARDRIATLHGWMERR